MPTNGIGENILQGVSGAPIFTYGMICITAVVLSYITLIEPPEPKIEENVLEPIATATGIPEFIPFSTDAEETSSPSPIPVFPAMEAPFSPAFSEAPTAEGSPVEGSPVEGSPVEGSPVEAPTAEGSPVEAPPSVEEKKGGVVKKKKSRMHKPKENAKRKTIKSRGLVADKNNF